MRLSSLVAIITCLALAHVDAQAPAFDAASVRPTKSQLPGGVTDFRAGGRFTAENVTLLELIRPAYDLDTYRILGGPDWIRRDRFDVQAQAGAAVSRDETRTMLRTLLADRFRLRVRIEPRELPIYALVISRRDGKPGPRLRTANPAECVDRGPQPQPTRAGDLPSCGLLPQGPGRMTGRSVPISLLTTQLSSITGRVVRDRTGLTGLFDIDVDWGLTEAQVAALARLTPIGGTPPVFDPDKPTVFTAVDEQLGVKLESSMGPVDVIVVESVERPTEN